MITTKKELTEGSIIPPFYGIAYWKMVSNTAVCYPWPFNHIVYWLRCFWFWARDASRKRTF